MPSKDVGGIGLVKLLLSDIVVTMKTITRRQLSRSPAALKSIHPGESVQVPDGNEGLIITRRKSRRVTAEEMFRELEKLAPHCPPADTLRLSEDEA